MITPTNNAGYHSLRLGPASTANSGLAQSHSKPLRKPYISGTLTITNSQSKASATANMPYAASRNDT